MSAPMPQCNSCRFYENAGSAGPCKRHAPIAIAESAMSARWPWVSYYGWCGDHEPTPPREPSIYDRDQER